MKVPKPNFYNKRLRTKILVSILSAVAIVSFTVLAYVIINNERLATKRVFDYVDASAREHANLVKAQLDSDFAICRTINHSFHDYKNYSLKERNEIYNATMESVLENNKQFISVWTSWELNNIWKNYTKNDGRQSIVAYKEGNKILLKDEILDTIGTPSGLYYDIKANPSEILTEPYYYSYSGDKKDEILEASICIPMYDGGKYIGLVGSDVELKDLIKLFMILSLSMVVLLYWFLQRGWFLITLILRY